MINNNTIRYETYLVLFHHNFFFLLLKQNHSHRHSTFISFFFDSVQKTNFSFTFTISKAKIVLVFVQFIIDLGFN